ncbi:MULTISPECIES: acylphosphatase [unclassified Archaeoglobus]|uniref:acylphosphatase n=1 Tax=unclassified Archaeoglobus TaxID=2643606 RepID=UPI0032E488A3
MYRHFLFDAASIFNVSHFEARNVLIGNRQAVIVLVEGKEGSVQKFVEYIRSAKPPQAIVEDVTVEDYDGEVKRIGDYKDVLIIGQLNKIVQVGLMMHGGRTEVKTEICGLK